MRVASSAEMAAIDRSSQAEYRIPAIVLMENAGARALDALRDQGLREPVVFVAGKGNNGGDAFVMARHARVAGLTQLSIVLAGGPPRPGSEPAVNLEACRALGIEVVPFDQRKARARMQEAAWIVDGVSGTGLQGPLRPPLTAWWPPSTGPRAKRRPSTSPAGFATDGRRTSRSRASTSPSRSDCPSAACTCPWRAPAAAGSG